MCIVSGHKGREKVFAVLWRSAHILKMEDRMNRNQKNGCMEKGITQTGLKLVTLVSMVMGHIYYFFGYTNNIPWWFGVVGRVAAPLFLFCLVERFLHTRNQKNILRQYSVSLCPWSCLCFPCASRAGWCSLTASICTMP